MTLATFECLWQLIWKRSVLLSPKTVIVDQNKHAITRKEIELILLNRPSSRTRGHCLEPRIYLPDFLIFEVILPASFKGICVSIWFFRARWSDRFTSWSFRCFILSRFFFPFIKESVRISLIRISLHALGVDYWMRILLYQ